MSLITAITLQMTLLMWTASPLYSRKKREETNIGHVFFPMYFFFLDHEDVMRSELFPTYCFIFSSTRVDATVRAIYAQDSELTTFLIREQRQIYQL